MLLVVIPVVCFLCEHISAESHILFNVSVPVINGKLAGYHVYPSLVPVSYKLLLVVVYRRKRNGKGAFTILLSNCGCSIMVRRFATVGLLAKFISKTVSL